MPLADWMIPDMSLSAQAQLQNDIKVLRAHGAQNINDTVELTCSLMQQNALHRTLLRQAVGRVAELEMIMFLAENRRPSPLRRLARLLRLST